MADVYTEEIMDEYDNLCCHGELENFTHRTQAANPSCGDVVIVTLVVDEQTNQIKKIGWQGAGCVVSQVTMSRVAEFIHHHEPKLAWFQTVSPAEFLETMNWQDLSVSRQNCALVALRAIKEFSGNSAILDVVKGEDAGEGEKT